ncbi:hypothetical protein Q9L42_010060 [Methylomarinum sp. Ch1-1]|uniref:Transposase n=1 Tax=Methylomarinum roseum TaxID=3067653 RepID=A0AAU7NZN3_9GAMM
MKVIKIRKFVAFSADPLRLIRPTDPPYRSFVGCAELHEAHLGIWCASCRQHTLLDSVLRLIVLIAMKVMKFVAFSADPLRLIRPTVVSSDVLNNEKRISASGALPVVSTPYLILFCD